MTGLSDNSIAHRNPGNALNRQEAFNRGIRYDNPQSESTMIRTDHPDRLSPNIRWEVLICLLLAVLTASVYFRVIDYPFIQYDDHLYVSDNLHVQAGLTLKSVIWAFTRSIEASNYYIPLTWLSLIVDYELFGMLPGGYHGTNLILHILNAILLFIVLNGLTRKQWRSAVVAALFAVHPLNVESVAWVAERKNVLSTLFFLLTLWSYTRFVNLPDTKRFLWVMLFFLFGLLSKPMLVTLPLVLLLLDYWPLDRFHSGRRSPNAGTSPHRSTQWFLCVEKIPLFILSAACSIITYMAQQSEGAIASIETYPLHLRLENTLVSYVRYVMKTIWPKSLSIIYPYPTELAIWQVVCAAAMILFIAALIVRWRNIRPWFAVGWLWYFITLVPVIGLVVIGPHGMADRYAYIPLMGLFILPAWGLPAVLVKFRFAKIGVTVLVGAVISVLAFISYHQVGYWKNSIALFQHTVNHTSNNPIARHNLALALMERGQMDEAIDNFYHALEIKPAFPRAHTNIGVALAKLGRYPDAIRHYTEALRLNPNWAGALYNLGNALAAQGEFNDAVETYNRALALSPHDAEIHNNLGNALFKNGKVDEALNHYKQAVGFKPAFVPALLNLAKVYAAKDEYETARSYFKKAVALEPEHPEAYYFIAATYAKQNHAFDSAKWLEKAVQQGFNNWAFFQNDGNFDHVRQSSDYEKLMERLSGPGINMHRPPGAQKESHP